MADILNSVGTSWHVVENAGLSMLIALLLIVATVYYFVRVLPEDRAYRRRMDAMMVEQLSLSRQALDTSNSVIQQNSAALVANSESHARLGQRMEGVEKGNDATLAQVTDIRADTSAIKAVVCG